MIVWPKSDEWARMFPTLCGRRDLTISRVGSLSRPKDNAVIFASKLTEQSLRDLAHRKGCLLLLNEADRGICGSLMDLHGVLFSDDPRYHFAEVLSRFWDPCALRGALSWDPNRGIILGANVQIDPSAVLEPGLTIAHDCVIRPRVYVMTGARLGPRVEVGEGSVIRENAVIGGWGFGFAKAPGKPTIRIPHVGGVVIGRNVEIGALTTVCSGTIDPTIIEDHVKIDDHVHIAHNCRIQENVIVTACAEVSGGVSVGRGTWLGPNCSVIDRITIGAESLVGIGAVVTKPVGDRVTVVGNHAQSLQERAAQRRALRGDAGRE